MRTKPVTWFLLADGEHCRIVARGADGAFRTELEIDSATAHQRSFGLGADRPGRSYESVGMARHAIAPRHDSHKLAEAEFLRFLASEVSTAAGQGAYDRLVLVAPVRHLPILRAALGHAARAALCGEVSKDLLKVPDHELGRFLVPQGVA
jgi:protein required for attachment to host cells